MAPCISQYGVLDCWSGCSKWTLAMPLPHELSFNSVGQHVNITSAFSDEDESLNAIAKSLWTVARQVQNDFNEEFATPTEKEEDAAIIAYGRILSVVLLRSFAAECFLKAISSARCGSYEKTHDLVTLFDNLDDPIKTFIGDLADEAGLADPKRMLERHRKDFVEWRYRLDSNVKMNLKDLEGTLYVVALTYVRIKNKTAPPLPVP